MANNYGSLEGTMDANGILGGEIQFNGAGGKVKDVQVNDVSVVDANGIAKIDLTDYAKTEDIPADLADLQDDETHRLVTDAEKTEWSGKSNVSANPSTTTETLTGIEIDGTAYAIPSGDVTDVKVNDTSVVDENGVANIDLTGYAEKSDLGTASALDVAVSGDASTSQVVKGDDTRLTDARPASDVSSWAKASTKPDYTASEVGAIATTAKGTANGVAELDENGKVPSAQLPSYVDDVLEYASVSVFPATGESGKIYIALDTNKTYRWSGTTYTEISESLALGETDSTAYAGNKGKQNADNIATIQGLIPSSATTSNKLATASDIPDISGKADKSEMSVSTSGDQTTIQLKNGTSATVLNAHQSITGKADKVTNATENNFAALDANGNLKDSGHKHSDYLTQHQDISGKADKVSSASNGNLAGLNGSGNLTDSGWNGAKDTTSISGNPISIPNLKSNQLAVNPIITLEPIQDLHGQSKPYPAGGGKNKLLLSTQSGTYGDVVTTVNSDGTILCNGTASAEVNITLYNGTLPSGTYRINGNPSGASSTTYRMRYRVNSGSWNYISSETSDPDVTLASTDTLELRILIASGVQISNKLWKPMIRLATETDSSFAPYENICPISGYDKIEVLSCGKNLFDKSEVVLGGLDATTGEETSSTTTYRSGWIRVKASTTYVLSGFANVIRPYYYGQGGAFIERDSSTTASTFTTPSGCAYVRFQIASATWTGTSNPQLEEAQTATTYTPYNKTTSISESLGQTVYYGELDVRSGKFKVTHGEKDMGDLTYSYNSTYERFGASVSDMTASLASLNWLCECYETSGKAYIDSNRTDAQISARNSNIYIRDSRYTDGSSLKTALTGTKLIYPLTTPFEIQLTPHEISLLKDYAYVSTNGTNIALDYHNGELASLGDVSQLGETVEELDRPQERICQIDITSYTSSSNRYTIPFDGYITASLPTSSNDDYLRVYVYTHKEETMGIYKVYADTRGETLYTIAVKKGMKAMMTISTGYSPTVTFRGMA